MDPAPAFEPCCFPGPAAIRCPGYRPAAAAQVPDHLRYLPIFNVPRDEMPGCAHLAAARTPRGGFRAACTHPAGSPARWAAETGLIGRPVPREVPHRAVAP